MRITLAALVVALAGLPAGRGAPVPPDAVPPDVVKAVKAKLPAGWTATVRGATLTVRREKKVGLINAIGRPPSPDGLPPAPDRTEHYELVLTFRPRVTAAAFGEMEKENAETETKLDTMRDGLRAARIAHKFDDWLPGTPEQKKLVAEYRAAQKALPYHRLPDAFTETRSIDFDESVGHWLSFTNGDEAKECRDTRDAVRALFKAHAR
ncbi:MAG: hypothetical protein FJ304_26365 [Planctomycetes bacterium]|nr:hypothetical protein [Planctomycetota bacterium]